MDILNVLKERRSVKKYKDIMPDDESINKIVEAGLYAACGRGTQGVKFLVVKNKELVKELSKLNAAIMEIDKDPFYNAPVVIVVFANSKNHTYIEDGSLALGNMMNEAYSIGIDSCWIHRAKEMFESERGRKIAREYGIEDDYVGIGNCILGYIDGEFPNTKDRLDNRVVIVE